MTTEENTKIKTTTDPEKFAVCASMMSESDPWITLGMNYDYCLKAFDGSYREVYVIEYKNVIAGFVIIQIYGSFKGYIQTICISPDYRNMGLGKKLLRFSEERILKISPNIFICVSSFNKGAEKLYYKLGYKFVGKLENFVREGFTELLLRKTVGPMVNFKSKEQA